MILDLHIHEKTHSSDSHMELDDIIEKAKDMGLDGICITDHDSMGLKDRVLQMRKEQDDFVVLIGAEILTFEGDILAFGLDEVPDKMMHAKDLLKLISDQGGVGISAHPYRKNNRGLEDHIKTMPGLSAIEGLNGSTPDFLNGKAIMDATMKDEPFTGGSDAHEIHRVGRYATKFYRTIRNESDLIEAIKNKEFDGVYYDSNCYRLYDEKVEVAI